MPKKFPRPLIVSSLLLFAAILCLNVKDNKNQTPPPTTFSQSEQSRAVDLVNRSEEQINHDTTVTPPTSLDTKEEISDNQTPRSKKWGKLVQALNQGIPVTLKTENGGHTQFWMRPKRAVTDDFQFTLGTDKSSRMNVDFSVYEGFGINTIEVLDENLTSDSFSKALFSIVGEAFAAVIIEPNGETLEISTNPQTGELEQSHRPIIDYVCKFNVQRRMSSIEGDSEKILSSPVKTQVELSLETLPYGGQEPHTGDYNKYLDIIIGGQKYEDSLLNALLLVAMDKSATGDSSQLNLQSKASMQLAQIANISTIYENQIGCRILVQELIMIPDSVEYIDIPYHGSDTSTSLNQFRDWGNEHRPIAEFPRTTASKIGAGLYGTTLGIAKRGSNSSVLRSESAYNINRINLRYDVLTHELGHNFGSQHTSGGIMNATSSSANAGDDTLRNFFKNVVGKSFTASKQIYDFSAELLHGSETRQLRHPEEIPFANNDVASTPLNTPITIGPLANDLTKVLNGQTNTLAVEEVGAVLPLGAGSVSYDSSTLTFTPSSGFQGVAWFSYTIRGSVGNVGKGWLHKGDVAIQVGPEPEPQLQLIIKPGDSIVHYFNGLGFVHISTYPEQAIVIEAEDASINRGTVIIRAKADASGRDTLMYFQDRKEYTVNILYLENEPQTRPDHFSILNNLDVLRFNPLLNDDLAGTRDPSEIKPVLGVGTQGHNIQGLDLFPNGYKFISATLDNPADGSLTLEKLPYNLDSQSTEVFTGFITYTPSGNASGAVHITYVVEDAAGIQHTESILITIGSHTFEEPTGILLSNGSIEENTPSGTTIGILSAIDPDVDDIHTFQLSPQQADNTNFSIVGNQLKTNTILDFEDKSNFTIEIMVTDLGGNTKLQTLPITVTNVNDAPKWETIEDQYIKLNTAKTIGLTAQDDDQDSISYSVSQTSKFQTGINGTNLTITANNNFIGTETITITAEDGHGAKTSLKFKVTTYLLSLSNSYILDGAETNSLTGSFSLGSNTLEITPESVGKKIWEYSMNTNSYSSVAYYDSKVIAVDTAGRVYALDATYGYKIWEIPLGTSTFQSPAIGADGTVYVGAGSGTLYAINGKNGEIKWEFPTGANINISPSISTDGTIYIGAENGKIFAIKADGTKLWERVMGKPVNALTLDSNNVAYFTTQSFKLYAVKDNQELWEINTNSYASGDYSATLGSNQRLYMPVGSKVWEVSTNTHTKLQEFSASSSIRTTPVINNNGIIFAGSDDRKLYAWNTETGNLIWQNPFNTGGAISSSPAIGEDGTIYVGSDSKHLFAIDATNGTEKWKFTTGGQIKASPVIGPNGAIYITSNDRKVYAIQGSSPLADSPWPMFGQNPQRTSSPFAGAIIYELVNGEGSTDNGSFILEGNNLRILETANSATKSSYSIRVKAIFEEGFSTEKKFSLLVLEEGSPTEIILDNSSIGEDVSGGSTIGNLTAVDEDPQEQHTFTLVDSPEGSQNDNHLFQILQGSVLATAQSAEFDFETKASHTIRVQVSDKDHHLFSQDLEISITDVNEPPTSFTLDNLTVAENQPAGTSIGNFNIVDEDVNDTHLITVVQSSNSSLVEIEGKTLKTSGPLDFETLPSFELTFQAIDGGNNSKELTVTIQVTNQNEPPSSENSSITTEEDSAFTFNSSSFPFNDEENDPITKVKLQPVDKGTLWIDPNNDELLNNGEQEIGDDDEILASNLTNLRYLPDENDSGQDYATFEFQVHDGNFYSTGKYTMTIHVTGINDLPTSEDKEVTTNEDSLFSFQENHFSFLDVDRDSMVKIKLKSATSGTLWHDLDANDVPDEFEGTIADNDELAVSDIKNLSFLPDENESGNEYATFEFQVHDGTAYSVDTYTMTIHVLAVNDPPISQDTTVTTSVGEVYAFSIDDFSYQDIENSQFFSLRLQEVSDGTLWIDDDENGTIDDDTLVSNNMVISVAQISQLKFLANLKDQNSTTANFQFEISDGENFSQIKYTMTIKVATILLESSSVEENKPANTKVGDLSFSLDEGNGPIEIELDATQHVATEHDPQNPENYSLENAYIVEDLAPGDYILGYNPAGTNTAWSMSEDDIEFPKLAITANLTGWTNKFYYSLDGGQTKISHGTAVRFPSADEFLKAQYQQPLPLSISQGQSLQLYFREYYTILPIPGPGPSPELNNRGGLSLILVPATTTTFALASGQGDTDNAFFNVSGTQLLTAAPLDFETKETYSVRVQATDPEGDDFFKVFSITATDVNDTPTAISIDNDTLAENEQAGSKVGTLSATDQDANESHTFVLTQSAQHPDNEAFTINQSNELLANASLNFEEQASYTIQITATDNGQLTVTKELTINVGDINEVPEGLTLSSVEIGENNPVGSTVGTVTISDQDGDEQHTLALSNTQDFPDNAAFTIDGTSLKTAAVFDFSTKESYNIEITVTDKGQLTLSQEFTISVREVELDTLNVNENVADGTVVGTLGFPLPDAPEGDAFPAPIQDSVTYEFATGEGDSDNSEFTITANKLLINESPNFETKSSYSIRVKATNGTTGLNAETQFTISINDLNEVPLGITLDNNEKDENEGDDTKIGNLDVIDPDAGDSHTFAITGNDQYPDNDFFLIQNNELLGNQAFNFEEKSSYTIEVEVTDSGDLSHKQELTINVRDVNEAPEEINISENRVGENMPIDTAIGSFNSVDQDSNERHSYVLTNFEQYRDNVAFRIVGNTLLTGAVLDYNTKNTYTIQVKSTDKGGLTHDEEITIVVATSELFNPSIEENVPNASVVGTLAFPVLNARPVGEPGPGLQQPVAVTFEKVAGDGDTDNDAFSINQNFVSINNSPDFETQSSYSLRIRATADDGLIGETVFNIAIIDVNEVPTAITLLDNEIPENEQDNTAVGNLGVVDQDQQDQHSFELTESSQYQDNALFSISGTELIANSAFNYEEKNVYKVEITVTDKGDLTYTQELTVRVTDVNEPSTAIYVSYDKFAEGREPGSLVAFMLTEDPDFFDTFTYELIDGEGSEDNGKFQINGNRLENAQALFLADQQFYNIRVRSTDAADHTVEDTFRLEAIDMSENEAPTELKISKTFFPENQVVGTTLATFSFVDGDSYKYAGGVGTYSLVYSKFSNLAKARNHAQKKGGHPAVLSSKPEWNIMLQQVGVENLAGKTVILGATDEQEEGVWKWLTDEPFYFYNWAPNQPDNGGGSENHMTIWDLTGDKLQWNDLNTDQNPVNYFLLEQPVLYELVEGDGDTDNHRYNIIGNRLVVAIPGDYETQETHSIRVRLSDFGGLYIEKVFEITIGDGPDNPTGILLSNNTVDENLPIRAEVGRLTMEDVDEIDRPIFKLLTETPYFYINGDLLLTYKVLDYEAIETHTLNIEVTDRARLTHQQDFTITVLDTNDAPHDLDLSTYSVEENLPSGTEIATLTASDQDEGDSHTFQLIGGRDESYFRITGDKLSTTQPIDIEATPELEVLIQVTDSKKAIYEELVTLKILDTNDAPTGILLSTNQFQENLPQGSPIAVLSSIDQDPPFELVEGAITFDQAQADAVSRAGHLATFKDVHEWNRMLQIIEAEDLIGKSFWLGASDEAEEGKWEWIDGTTPFTYSRWAKSKYLDAFEFDPPNNDQGNEHHLALSSLTENRLEWDDVNRDSALNGYILEKTSSYQLVSGTGDTDNASFQIVGNQLQMKVPADFEAKATYSIRIETTDPGGLTYQESFQLTVLDGPDAPLGITISPSVIPENKPKGFQAGVFSALDTDANSSFTYSLDPDEQFQNDNDLFYISRDKLLTYQPFDFERRTDYIVRIIATDKDNLSVTQDLSLTIGDENDAPSGITIDNSTLLENQPSGTAIGIVSATDQDAEDKHTFAIIGGRDKDLVYFKRETLYSEAPIDFEFKQQLDLLISTTDNAGVIRDFPLSITIQNENDAPTDLLLSENKVKENANAGTVVGTLSLVDQDQPSGLQGPPQETFTLVPGKGDDDNSKFTIVGNELHLAAPLNFEEKVQYSILLEGADAGGLTFTKTLIIEAIDQPDAPTALTLTSPVIQENTQENSAISEILVSDEDGNENHQLALVPAPANVATDNQYFSIQNGRNVTLLRTLLGTVLDYELKPFYRIYVEVTDKDDLTFGQFLEISLTNVNEPTTDLILSNSKIEENLPTDTEVGTISAIDLDIPAEGTQIDSLDKPEPEYSDTFTFLMARGDGDSGNRNFRLDRTSGVLTTAKVFDFESSEDIQQSIRVGVTDGGGNTFEKILLLSVINANDAPHDLELSPALTAIEEGLTTGTFVANLIGKDVDTVYPNFGEQITYSLVSGPGDTNNINFQIVDDELQIQTPLSFASTQTATFRIQATDKAGEEFSKSFSITVTDQNDAPTTINLSNNTVLENKEFGTLIGTFTASDPDVNESHTFNLVSGTGDSGNASFFVQNGNELVTNAALDFESQNTYSIRVQVKDKEDATFEDTFSIQIQDEPNEIPRYELIVNRIPSNGGLTTGAGLHEENSTASLSVSAGPGYTFAGWTGDLPVGTNSGDTEFSIRMDGNKTLNAYFARQFHEVDVRVSPDRHGYAHGGGNVLSGSEITITAEELSGEDNVPFSHWRINGVDKTKLTNSTLTMTAEENLKIEAVFDIGLESHFNHIPAGSFTRNPTAQNEHTAQVSAFYTTQTETTKEQWYNVYNWAIHNGYTFAFDPIGPNGRNRAHNDKSYKDDLPITGITWNDMVKWCNAKSEMEGLAPVYFTDDTLTTPYRTGFETKDLTADFVDWRGRGYRLPTELEWEYAARGGLENLTFPNGNTIDESQAYYNQDTVIRAITSVSNHSRPANGYGLYDMSGNAWEACWDWYSKTWQGTPAAEALDDKGPNLEQTGMRTNFRTSRGGSGNSPEQWVRIGNRTLLKTWLQYAITIRPVFPAPTTPDAVLTLENAQSHLGSVTGGGTYKIDADATLTAIPDTDATFLGWYNEEGDLLDTSATLTVTMDTSKTITAQFSDDSNNPTYYTLSTISSPTALGSVSGAGAYLAGSNVTITATPVDGYDFAGWTGDAVGTEATLTIQLNKNKTLTAIFGDISLDTDQDGLSDLYENSLGSSPYDQDSDGDKIYDGIEVMTWGTNPTLYDTDNDGFDDRIETVEKTDPNDPLNFPFIPQNNLIRHFRLDGLPYDYSGNRGTGTATDNGSAQNRFGQNKRAYSFNGTSTFVETTGYNGAIGSSARAISGWIRMDQGNQGPILAYGNFPNHFSLLINNTGTIELSANGATHIGNTSLDDGNWHQFLVSIKEDGTPADIEIFLDGIPENTILSGDTGQPLTTSSNSPILIGKNPENDFFTGDMDDIRIWERPLIAFEATKLFDMEAPREPDEIRPTITQQPLTQTVAEGEDVTFSVTVEAKPEPTYSWEVRVGKLWEPIKGADEATLTITDAEEEDAQFYRVQITNSAGTVSSSAARLYVWQIPQIAQEPEDIAFLVNRGGRIDTNVSGTAPLYYEWFKDGASLGVASKNNSFIIPKTANQVEHGGAYSYKVTNSVGEATSQDFTVSIIEPVTITQDPVDTGILKGATGSLQVVATGGGTLTYQWKKYDPATRKYVDVSGATSDTLSVARMSTRDEGIYLCEVSNGPSTFSSRKATLDMLVVPTFLTQPRDLITQEFQVATFTSLAEGDPAPAYQWQKQNPQNQQWEDIPKMTKADLILKKVSKTASGVYRVVATNDGGQAISNEVDLLIQYKPVITQQLVTQTANEDTDVTFSVIAEGLDLRGTTLSYAWFHNKQPVSDGSGISGSRTANLTLSSVDKADAGTWTVTVSNSVGDTPAKAVKLTIVEKPYVTTDLADIERKVGSTLTLAVSVRGTKPFTYRWLKDGQVINGATLNKLSIRPISLQDAGIYTFEATNDAGTLTLTSNVTITAASVTPAEGNIATQNLDSPTDDSDGDGLSNLLEEALGSDPANPDSTYAPVVDLVEDGNGQQFMSFQYTESKAATGVTTFVEVSSDLKNWEPLDLNTISTTQIDRSDLTETTLYIPSTSEQRFFRIRVEK